MNRYFASIRTLSQKVRYRLFDSFPSNVHFAVTNRCNLSCVFCGQDKDALKKEDELTEQDYRQIIDEISEIGKRTLSFSGGEIFLHPGIINVLEYCSFMKQKIGMVLTNGVLVSEEVAHMLVSSGVEHVGFSIDGTREVHDALRGVTGSYDRAIKAIQHITHVKKKFDSRIPSIGINFVVTPANVGVIDCLANLLAEGNISSVRFQLLTYISEETLHCHEEKLRALSFNTSRPYWQGFRQDYTHINGETVLEKIEKVRRAAMLRGVPVYVSPRLDKKDIERWYGSNDPIMHHCFFPYQSFLVLPNGDVPLCDFIRFPVGNVRESALLEIWNSKQWKNFRRERLIRLFPGCERCCQLS